MSPRRATSQADLGKMFGSVTQVLKENRATLNQADDFNHNHGDNMVDTFQVITQAMREKKGSQPAEQLAYASQKLSQQAQSGSAKLYSQGLAQASDRIAGQTAITPQGAISMLQALMGGQTQAGPNQSGAGDLLGALLGGQTPNAPSGQESGGIDLNTLLGAGMAFMQARQQGAEPLQAVVQAVMAGSQMNSSTHRAQSGQLVAETLINTLGSMLGGGKK